MSKGWRAVTVLALHAGAPIARQAPPAGLNQPEKEAKR